MHYALCSRAHLDLSLRRAACIMLLVLACTAASMSTSSILDAEDVTPKAISYLHWNEMFANRRVSSRLKQLIDRHCLPLVTEIDLQYLPAKFDPDALLSLLKAHCPRLRLVAVRNDNVPGQLGKLRCLSRVMIAIGFGTPTPPMVTFQEYRSMFDEHMKLRHKLVLGALVSHPTIEVLCEERRRDAFGFIRCFQLTKSPTHPIGDFPSGVPIGLKQVCVSTDLEPVTSSGGLPAYYESAEYLHISPNVPDEGPTADLLKLISSHKSLPKVHALKAFVGPNSVALLPNVFPSLRTLSTMANNIMPIAESLAKHCPQLERVSLREHGAGDSGGSAVDRAKLWTTLSDGLPNLREVETDVLLGQDALAVFKHFQGPNLFPNLEKLWVKLEEYDSGELEIAFKEWNDGPPVPRRVFDNMAKEFLEDEWSDDPPVPQRVFDNMAKDFLEDGEPTVCELLFQSITDARPEVVVEVLWVFWGDKRF